MKPGIICVSHSEKIVEGLKQLLDQIAKDVPMSFAGGTDEGEIGTSYDKISKAIEENVADELLAFFDLGSARMNLEMASEMGEKPVQIMNVPLIEGAYAAAALMQAQASMDEIRKQLKEMEITK